jgi:hypothetical protein
VEWSPEAPRFPVELSVFDRDCLDQLLYLVRQGYLGSNQVAQSVYAYHEDSVDGTYSATLKFWLPHGTVKIVEMGLRLALLPFRAYSKTAEAGGGQTSSSSGSHYHSVTTDDHTHGQQNDIFWDNPTSTVDGHSHTYDDIYPLGTTAGGGGTVWTSSSSGSHWHTVSSHTHAAVYGIYESTSATGVTVTINGTDRTAALGGGAGFTADQNWLDINQSGWLTFGLAEADSLNTIILTSTQLGRIRAQMDGLIMRAMAA